MSVAVQLRQKLWPDAGTSVEIVRVLRDEKLGLAQPLQFDQSHVGGIGLDLTC
jgi:hypothetical protein